MTINYKLFSLKDLEPNESVLELRGKGGVTAQIMGQDLEKFLFTKVTEKPEDMYLNFASGNYISHGIECNCLNPEFFGKEEDSDFKYFEVAYKKGLFNSWSLFRIGYHYHVTGDLDNAVLFYEKAYKEDPNHITPIYNLSIVFLNKGNYQKALFYSNKSLGMYKDPKLDADTYHVNGVINRVLGNLDTAEQNLTKALELVNHHEGAFIEILNLYRQANKSEKYKTTVFNFISTDFSNVYYFNKYVEFLARNNAKEIDQSVYESLVNIDLKDKSQIGPFYYNLGRFAFIRGDTGNSLKHYNASLSAFKTMENPPDGAIDALKSLIADLKEKTQKN